MEEIKIARLLDGFSKFDDGNVNPVYKGNIQTEFNDEPLSCFFKIVSKRELLVESVCSLMARHLNLPTPEPYLVIMREGVCPIEGNPSIPAFGTVDAKAPSFRQYVTGSKLKDSEIKQRLMKWRDFASTAAFDEFIANGDRHIGNLLYDGKNFSFIDHGLSMREYQRPDIRLSTNQLFNVVADKDEVTRIRYRKAALKETPSYGTIPFNLLSAKTLATEYIDDASIEQVVSFLLKRIDYVNDHIFNQLNFTVTQQSLR